jgi:hypothetical protein
VFPELDSALRASDQDIALALRHPDFLPAVRAAENPVRLSVCQLRPEFAEAVSCLGTEIQELVVFRSSGTDVSRVHPEYTVKQEDHADQIHNIVCEDRDDHQDQRRPEADPAQIIGTVAAVHELLHFLTNTVHSTNFSCVEILYPFILYPPRQVNSIKPV